jgi:DNA-binding NarL/FixJ family response regulator
MSGDPGIKNVDGGGRPLDGLHVLLVEDSWHVAQAVKSLLELNGAQVVGPTATVEEASALVASRHLDAGIVDINLNGVMTFGVVELLERERVPTVVVTGYGVMPELAGRVVAVLPKPVRAGELIDALCIATMRGAALPALVSSMPPRRIGRQAG